MSREDKISAAIQLGEYLEYFKENELEDLLPAISAENPWFTPENVHSRLDGILYMLQEDRLDTWLKKYGDLPVDNPRKIGLILAGNLPLVGFHDILCCYLSGHEALVKCSHQDTVLVKHVIEKLKELDPRARIQTVDKLSGMDAVIATGSDNSARYFHQYFGKYPHIIRKNRTGAAVLTGDESEEELAALSEDVFDHYGLGCRNVSHLVIPADFDLVRLGDLWQGKQGVIHLHKYANNYDYQKSILLVNKVPHLDFGFLLLREDIQLTSPISVLHYHRYRSIGEVNEYLEQHSEQLQVVVASEDSGVKCEVVPFGMAQRPEPWNYADKVDTLEFLRNLV